MTLNPDTTAFVIIDLQRGVVAFPVAPHSASAVIDNAARALQAARAAGATVVLVHTGPSADGRDRLAPPADSPMTRRQQASDWAEFVPEIGPRPGDLVIQKRQWGAFYGTELDLQLRRRHVSTVVLGGIATEFGVESTARSAYEHGYSQIFLSDAMSGLSVEGHENALTRIFPRIGGVRDTATVIAALSPPGVSP
jgi:nicotinamidase-related amidase